MPRQKQRGGVRDSDYDTTEEEIGFEEEDENDPEDYDRDEEWHEMLSLEERQQLKEDED